MNKLLEEYAELTVAVGANIQKGQTVVIRSSTESTYFTRLITEKCYQRGAKEVIIEWSDHYVNNFKLEYASDETLSTIPDWLIEKHHYYIKENVALIAIASPVPGLNEKISGYKFKILNEAKKKLDFFSNYTISDECQWTIVAYPNEAWAQKVFKDLDPSVGCQKLLSLILEASRVGNDTLDNWKSHNERLSHYNQVLNEFNFKSLYFKNSLGTDITIGLVKDHIWAGGSEVTKNGIVFNPNIPTEENFTMPDKTNVNGVVYATKPLDYNGKLITDFFLEFKDGKVVNFDALGEKETLKAILETDEGASFIGEIALISNNTPISLTNILFYMTLFDENASCHMALGRAYPMNIKNGNQLELDALLKMGYNYSNIHIDFMFGSSDMEVWGITYDNKRVQLFKDGDFVI